MRLTTRAFPVLRYQTGLKGVCGRAFSSPPLTPRPPRSLQAGGVSADEVLQAPHCSVLTAAHPICDQSKQCEVPGSPAWSSGPKLVGLSSGGNVGALGFTEAPRRPLSRAWEDSA